MDIHNNNEENINPDDIEGDNLGLDWYRSEIMND
jgi:hypothetical protein